MKNSSDAPRLSPILALGASKGFRPLALFASEDVLHAVQVPEAEISDPIENARADGYTLGYAEGRAAAEADMRETLDAYGPLSSAFERLDQAMEEQLRLALHETVSRLCEGVLAPLALDEEALLARIDKAVAMLSRTYDERTIRLNPEDVSLLSDRLHSDWDVVADPSLPRGTLRIESTDSGIEDGPETWRRAIAEALGPC